MAGHGGEQRYREKGDDYRKWDDIVRDTYSVSIINDINDKRQKRRRRQKCDNEIGESKSI